MYELLRLARSKLLDVLFPPSCGVCGAEGGFLCPACRRGLLVAAPPRCRRCWAPSKRDVCENCQRTPLDGARAAYLFEGGARSLVLGLKYRSLHALAEPMGELLAEAFLEEPLPVDLVAPVPLHSRRERIRGFNQAELLGRAVAGRAALELDIRSLRRMRSTPQQTRTDDRQRRETNVRGAFQCSPAVAGRRVLLIDDVLTTGATLRECARTLREAGAASVWALTFCRAERDR